MPRLLITLSALLAPVRIRLRSDDGLEAIEYALLAALIAALIVAAVALLDPAMDNIFNAIAARLDAAATAVSN